MATTSKTAAEARPYKPSWIDRFNNWVEGLPVRAWVFFAAIGLAFIGVQVLVLWLAGGLDQTVILPVIVFNSLFTPFLLALIYYLDLQAVAALDTMRPVLTTTESEYAGYRYALANMPLGVSLVAGLVVLVLATLMEQLWVTPVRYAPLEQLPVFTVVFQIIDKSSAFLFGVFIYHTVRQLRLVSRINASHVSVSLFNQRPLQAFSRLTGATSIGLLVGIYGWLVINPDLLGDPVILVFTGAVTLLAVVVFVAPLLSAHRLMAAEKDRLRNELDRRFETAFAEFNEAFGHDDYDAVNHLNGGIASLETQQRKLNEIPTWPWKPETARFIFSAIALPLVISALRFLVERAFSQ